MKIFYSKLRINHTLADLISYCSRNHFKPVIFAIDETLSRLKNKFQDAIGHFMPLLNFIN